MNKVFTPTVRRWIYGIAIAAIALAVQQGLIDSATALVIAPLVLAILNVKPDGGDGGSDWDNEVGSADIKDASGGE